MKDSSYGRLTEIKSEKDLMQTVACGPACLSWPSTDAKAAAKHAQPSSTSSTRTSGGAF
jgi:hypothetical protein